MIEETKIEINLDTIEKVRHFVEVVNLFEEEITIISLRYEVDAKSIMAIFSLNLLEPITVCLYCDNSRVIDTFIDKMEEFKIL